MKLTNNHIVLFVLAGTLVMSCIEEIQHIGRPGTLIGYVSSFGNHQNVYSDQSGVAIRVEGGDEIILVETDAQGRFEIQNLTTGTYDIELSRAGFGTHKIIGHTFVGGDNPSIVTSDFFELPDVTITDFTVKNSSSETQVIMECTFELDFPDEGPTTGNYRYYIGNNALVSVSDYIETGLISSNSLQASVVFLKTVNTNLFPPGTNLYIVIYPCTDSSLSYIDIITGNLIFSTVKADGPSVVSFTVPDS